MNALTALTQLKQFNIAVFTSNDAATLLKISISHATHLLRQLHANGNVIKLYKGLWGFSEKIDRLALPGYLCAPLPVYISLLTALQIHGIIEQIPETIYAVSIARSKKIQTVLGTVSIHHVDLGFFWGYEETANPAVFIASPEKALIDYLYLKPAKGAFFKSLPEVDLSQINQKKALKIIDKIPYAKRRQMVLNAFKDLG